MLFSYISLVVLCTNFLFGAQIQAMQKAKKPGVIINVGSASGLYPMYADPIYSGSKGLLLFAFVYTSFYYFSFNDI